MTVSKNVRWRDRYHHCCVLPLQLLQQIEEFTAMHAELGLKERWEIHITAIQMTTNHKTPEIITPSDLFNGMHTMIALGAMTFQE